MVRFTMLVMALVVGAGASSVCGQDTDEVKALKKENELLKKEIELLTRENALLKEENKKLKAGVLTSGGKSTLADILTEGTTIRGDYRFRGGNKAMGDWSLTIKERTGKRFKGSYTAAETSPNKNESVEVDAEGVIDGNRLFFKIVNTTKIQASATGTLKNEVVELTWNGRAGIADMKAKVQK